MPQHLYLPRLDVKANVGMPPRSAHWHRYGAKILTAVSDGIIVDDDARQRGTSSVPDVWARPLLFASALRPSGDGRQGDADVGGSSRSAGEHPLRARLLREWRGLISLLALRQLYRYNVEIVPVSLKSDGDSVFDSALERLAPPPVRLEAARPYKWTDVLLIRYNRVPVGAFSPATLVYTGVDYAPRLKALGAPLTDSYGFLQPPEAPHDLAHVGKWLQALQRTLNENLLWTEKKNPDGSTVESINALLGDWVADIRRGLNKVVDDEIAAPRVRVAEDVVAAEAATTLLSNYRIYGQCARPLDREPDEFEPVSPVAIACKRNLSGRKQVLVITPQLLERNVELWRGQHPQSLGSSTADVLKKFAGAASGHEIGATDLRPDNVEWIRPERFFLSDTLLRAAEGQSFVAPELEKANLGPRYLLPFRREILNFFSPEQIIDVLRPRYKETDTGVTFQFTLPVGRETQVVERTYRRKSPAADEGAIVDVTVPVAEIFPVARPKPDGPVFALDANWRRYWLVHDQADTMMVEPVVNGESANIQARTQRDSRGRTARIVSMAADTRDLGDAAILPFPEALAFTGVDKKPYGLVLLPIMPIRGGLTGKMLIGIDFGTSNTNVYRRDSSDAMAPAVQWAPDFSKYVWSVSRGQTARRDATLQEFFVPSRPVKFPIPTALRLFDEPKQEEVFLDFGIPFPRPGEFTHEPNVYTNIKWNVDEERKTQPFLKTLAVLLLVEATVERVKTLEFIWSYPKAFSDHTIGVYLNEWNIVVNSLLGEDAGRVTRTKAGATATDRVEFTLRQKGVVEGKAAGEFFAHDLTTPRSDDQALRSGAICLDVGGGTTDISVWHAGEIESDASVLLAGRDVSDLLAARPQLLQLLFSGGPTGAAATLEQLRAKPTKFAACLNLVLKHEEDRIHEMLVKYTNFPEVQWLRRMLVVQFGAIAAYAGTLVAALDRGKSGALKTKVQHDGMKLHWGGNAAKLINWLDFGRYDPDGVATNVLNAIFINTLRDYEFDGDDTSVGQRQSPGPKSEVAGGLVVMKHVPRRPVAVQAQKGKYREEDAEGEVADQSPGVVSGEQLIIAGREVSPLDVVSNATLFKGTTSLVDQVSLVRFEKFVTRLNKWGARFGLFSNETKIDIVAHSQQIATRLREELGRKAQESEDRRVIEPPFIMAVQVLLRRLREE